MREKKKIKTKTGTVEQIPPKAKFMPFKEMFFVLKLLSSYIVGVKIFFLLQMRI